MLVTEHLTAQKLQAISAVNAALALEKNPVFTQNFEYYSALRNYWLNKYRATQRVPQISPKTDEEHHCECAYYNEIFGSHFSIVQLRDWAEVVSPLFFVTSHAYHL